MRILIDINHPGHVHLFKYAIWEWQAHGHEILCVARDKDVTLALLEAYKLPYVLGTTRRPGLVNLALELLHKTARLVKISRQFEPDVILSLGSVPAAWASRLVRRPHIAFEDTEHSIEQYVLYAPFTKMIYTPSCFAKDLGRKQRRYAGYHELAYLHPRRFSPDPAVLTDLDLNDDEPFFVVRLVSWQATHDLNQRGVSDADKVTLINLLKQYGQVILTSEVKGAPEFLDRSFKISPIQIHHLLYYATMYVGEGGTMATEAALLGTPSIFINTLSGGNWAELEHKYRLLYTFHDSRAAIEKVRSLLQSAHLKETWRSRQQQLLADKIDVTALMVDVVEQVGLARNGRTSLLE